MDNMNVFPDLIFSSENPEEAIITLWNLLAEDGESDE